MIKCEGIVAVDGGSVWVDRDGFQMGTSARKVVGAWRTV